MDIIIRSDYPEKSLNWHLVRAQDLMALCTMIGVQPTETGIHGSAPFVQVENPLGEILGTIHQFKVGKNDQFLFSFDPACLGIEDVIHCPLEGWTVLI